jgi:hypothetical protein
MIDKRKADDMTTPRAVVRDRLIGLRVMLPEADIGAALSCAAKGMPTSNAGSARTIAVANVVGFEDTTDRNARHGEHSKI